MHKIGKSYPNGGYGGYFVQRLIQRYPKPYNRFGNGEATCVSPVVYVAKCIEEVKELSYQVTSVTHNHLEGIKGAEAIAVATYGKNRLFHFGYKRVYFIHIDRGI